LLQSRFDIGFELLAFCAASSEDFDSFHK